ncbi:restriction endonuclease subunit S [Streptomyces sp. SAI-127]|uniref:restriction endonuclease subunit S n=1 Tax=Streptomyces sp. SAI-127 TaxID=2940543 RepID=UPI0024735484|nr:restriction endonuclease subunit S [Streptomyces sp. SAI-127]MDH6490762.1 type I restriction enzyme S subunit [Streptomyces sp. SAI-127]
MKLKHCLADTDSGAWGDDPEDGRGVPVLRSTEIDLDGNLDLKDTANRSLTEREISRTRLTKGDLLVVRSSGSDAHLGKTGYVGDESAGASFSNFLQRLRLAPTHNSRFAWYFMNSTYAKQQIRKLSSTTTGLQNLSAALIGELEIPSPSLDEQRRIADFLDAETARIDHLAAKLHRQSQLVTEREDASIPMGVAGALLCTTKVRTGLPWMPFMNPDAQIIPLLRVLQLQRGVDLSDDQRIDGPVPVVTTAGLSGWHNRAIAEGPGVVIRRYGSRGNVHWVDSDYWPHNTTLYVKNFNGNSRRYCYHLLRALPYEMEQVKSAIPGVNRNDLHRLKVAMVPQSLQESVAEAMDSEMVKFHVAHERIQRLKQLLTERRQALITAAVTGQFDVSTASGRNVTDGVTA